MEAIACAWPGALLEPDGDGLVALARCVALGSAPAVAHALLRVHAKAGIAPAVLTLCVPLSSPCAAQGCLAVLRHAQPQGQRTGDSGDSTGGCQPGAWVAQLQLLDASAPGRRAVIDGAASRGLIVAELTKALTSGACPALQQVAMEG